MRKLENWEGFEDIAQRLKDGRDSCQHSTVSLWVLHLSLRQAMLESISGACEVTASCGSPGSSSQRVVLPRLGFPFSQATFLEPPSIRNAL